VGLERHVAQEESGGEKDFPGVRTFAFLALIGALAVLVLEPLGPWMSVAIFAATASFLVLRYSHDASTRGDPGYTTEIASLCTFAIGVLAQSGQLLVATILTIAMVALLRSKRALHRASDLLEPADMEALIRFLVIAGIILPLLPSQPLDAYFELPYFEVLRPRDIWRMVVLISGVSFVGYVLMRLRAGRASHVIMGMLGGLVSSTAAALTYARAARDVGHARPYEAQIVLAASTAFVRIAVMLAIVAPRLLPRVALPLLVMFAVGMGLAFVRHGSGTRPAETPAFRNPLKLRLAFTFATIYSLILLLVAAARERLGEGAVYTLSGLAALTGADAPSLSLARLEAHGQLPFETAVLGIVVVAIFTTVGKVGIVTAAGPLLLARRVVPTLLLIASAGALTLLLR
jgi:uncharacterized membrane protein (DUF4010 family)